MIDSGSKRNLSLNYHNNIIWGRRVERVRFAGGGGRGSWSAVRHSTVVEKVENQGKRDDKDVSRSGRWNWHLMCGQRLIVIKLGYLCQNDNPYASRLIHFHLTGWLPCLLSFLAPPLRFNKLQFNFGLSLPQTWLYLPLLSTHQPPKVLPARNSASRGNRDAQAAETTNGKRSGSKRRNRG